MSIFEKILSSLGIGKGHDQPAAPKPGGSGVVSSQEERRRKLDQSRQVPRKPAEMSAVDVVGRLEDLAAKNPQELNWKVSIVDLLKLLEINSSYENRKELAVELGAPSDMLEDSARMNTWLHKTVLQKIAENGGNIPRELLS